MGSFKKFEKEKKITTTGKQTSTRKKVPLTTLANIFYKIQSLKWYSLKQMSKKSHVENQLKKVLK